MTVVFVKENLTRLKEKIKSAAERVRRDPHDIRLIVVTKEAGFDQIREVIETGVTDIGENRVKEALLKRELFDSLLDRKYPTGLIWHMIGHLQSNKVKDAVKIFSIIHSVHSIRLAYIVDEESKKINKIQDILIEVNVSGEESKFGIRPDELGNFLEKTSSLKNINLLGLMTIAPLVDDARKTRSYFRKLKELADMYRLKELSMGMTQDFEVAIEEGATMVRIGSAIFKDIYR